MISTTDPAALEGVVVVENAQGVAASYAGRVLALMGATVIKLERPGTGDALRRQEPQLEPQLGTSAMFAYLNVQKSSVTLDLASAGGRKLLGELLDRASVFIDDTHPAERADRGIAPERLCAERPDLIYVSVLPFGAAGPYKDYRAYEINEFHAGGEGYLMPNGLALELFPDRPPVKVYGHFAELNGGTSAASATLAALFAQSDAGGQFVDVSVQDANIALSCFALQQLGEGSLENRHNRSFKYGGVLECSDGYVQILTLEQDQWESLVKLMGEPDWALDPQLKDPLERARRGAHINTHLRAWAKTQTVEDLVERGQAVKVPLAKYAEPADIFASAQTRERAMFAAVAAEGRDVPMLVAPFQAGAPHTLKSWPREPGADNARVLGEWLGHSAADLQAWAKEGAI